MAALADLSSIYKNAGCTVLYYGHIMGTGKVILELLLHVPPGVGQKLLVGVKNL